MSKSLKPVYSYCDDIIAGRIVAGKYARLAVERHLRDLDTGRERGLYFSESAAEHILKFAPLCCHSKGKWAGQPIQLEPWQSFSLAVQFGWQKADGLRRFRTALGEVARKNGKSTIGAVKGLYLLTVDGEEGAEIYCAATKKDQAKVVWSESRRMALRSPSLRRLIHIGKANLSIEQTFSKYEPLVADEDTLDGLNVHGGLIDEIHAHRTRGVYDAIDTGTGSREQPMIDIMTTAGIYRECIGYELHDYTMKVLEGVIEDDNWFGIIYAMDDKDDPFDPVNWIKANPNLNVSIYLSDLESKARKAQQMTGYYNAFLCKHLNRWVEQVDRWIPLEKWDRCYKEINFDELKNAPCYVGVDISSKLDLTAIVALFDLGDEVAILPYFFIPEETARDRAERNRIPYDVWTREGYIHATAGNIIDQDFIIAKIQEINERFDLQEVGCDPWNATTLLSKLNDIGIVATEVRQGYKTLSESSKTLEALIVSQRLQHDKNPVMRWNISNVAIDSDPTGNIKPSKKRSSEKIDGVAALVNALAVRSMHSDQPFIYNERGIYVG